MTVIKQAVPENAVILKGSLRNLLDGSRTASISQFVNKISRIHPLFMYDNFDRDYNMDEYLALHSYGATLVIYNHEYWLLDTENGDTDLIIVQGQTVRGYNSNSKKEVFNIEKFNFANHRSYEDMESFLDVIAANTQIESEYSGPDEYNNAAVLAFDPETGNLLTPYDIWGELEEDHIKGAGFNPINEEWKKPVDKEKASDLESRAAKAVENAERSASAAQKSLNNQPNQENKIMSKVNTLIASNKSAAVNAAKLEAGSIALKQLTKAAAKVMPSGMVGSMLKPQLDTPLGRVIVANLLNVAVEQYAPRNEKAKLIASAAMDAAMLEMVQSLNISKLIDELVSGIDISMFDKLED